MTPARAGTPLVARLRLSSTRLVILYVVLVGASVAALLAITYFWSQRALQAETDTLIASESDALVDEYRLFGAPQLVESLRLHVQGSRRSGAVYLLADARLQRLAGTLRSWPIGVDPQRQWVEFDAAPQTPERATPRPVRARLRHLPDRTVLLVGTDLSEQQRVLHRYRLASIWGVALSSLLAALLGVAYVRGVAYRVRTLAQTCERIIGGDLGSRLELDGSRDEFDQLATAVNRMLDRIEQQTTMLRTTFDSTAHDLRAPLYRLRMRLEEALIREDLPEQPRETMHSALEDLERVQRTLATLLQIAQAEAGGSAGTTTRIDLAELVDELVELYAPEARDRGIEMRAECAPHAWVQGHRQLLAQLVTNLLENALKYVPDGGHVAVSVTAAAPGHVSLTIADDGPGIPAADRARVLRPFQRLERDQGESGSGLGLSLVAAVARLHRASLSLEDNAPGLRVTCTFDGSA
ncbi:MAG: HAMP domain-containing sensor histidine kinase [Steroidobacteraceae bacterium]